MVRHFLGYHAKHNDACDRAGCWHREFLSDQGELNSVSSIVIIFPLRASGHAHGPCGPFGGLCHVPASLDFVSVSFVCQSAVLTCIRLGNAAIFLIGGDSREVEPVAILLRSGDTIIMSGPACRRAYHGPTPLRFISSVLISSTSYRSTTYTRKHPSFPFPS